MTRDVSPTQMLYHRGWFRAVETMRTGLDSSLLVVHDTTKELFVNFDTQILELLTETKYLKKLNLEIPDAADILNEKMDQIKEDREA